MARQWIQVVDHNTDRQSENEIACCKKLQRISELRDHSISLHSPNAWFQHGDTKLENPRYFCIERDLQGLDDEAWAFLKGEALPRLIATDPTRPGEPLFETLNEAKGYNHLVRIGCTNVKFIPRSTANTRTPDLQGLLASTNVLCEVKTINRSTIEIDRINKGDAAPTLPYLPEGFFNKLSCDLKTASSQLLAFSADAGIHRIAYIVVNLDERVECADEYRSQIETYIANVAKPDVEVVLDIYGRISIL